MAPKWIGFLVFVWVVALLLGSIQVGEFLGANTTVTSPIQTLMTWAEVWEQQGWGSALVYPVVHPYFWQDIGRIMLLDFPMFGGADSPWQLLRWLIMGPIIATVVWGMTLMVMQFFQKNI